MKIEEYVCSREQMKELQKLGFDTDKASMAWLGFDVDDWMVAIHNDEPAVPKDITEESTLYF